MWLIIYIIIPLIGLLCFLRLVKQMKNKSIHNPPVLELFIIFATYGGLILVTLTTLLWEWSGMASLGAFYLIFGAPIVLGIITYRHWKTKIISKYHRWIFIAGLTYLIIAPLTFFLLLLSEE